MAARWPGFSAEGFKAYVEKVLVPTLRPGDLVIMDNLPGRPQRQSRPSGDPLSRGKAVLPPQILARISNPIEQVFAKLKHLLRNAAARTIETVPLLRSGELLPDTFTPQECANYLANAGYRQT